MKPLTLQDIRKAVAGMPLAPLPAAVPPITEVCTDSRRMPPSSLFVALKGDRFDGHHYLRDVAAAGAIAAIVQDTPPPDVQLPNLHLIKVADTRVALGKLATFARKQMKAKVIAVAGSNGKTSTKHLIAAALSSKLTGTHSPKSFNNEIGVPLTIFPANPAQDFLVLEMGTNNPGEIHNLARMALPDIGVITNCSAEHLQGLGDLMGVRRENASLTEGLDKARGLLVVNGDDPELLTAVGHWPGRKLTFGFKPTNDLFATDVHCNADGVTFDLNGNEKVRFAVPLLGRHSACNALAAIAVGRRLGLKDDDIAAGLATAKGPEMRLQLFDAAGVTLLNDAYNANPASMHAALQTAADLHSPGRRLAVLGDMLELGRSSDRFHREVGQFLATLPFHAAVCVGPQARLIAEAAAAAGMDPAHLSTFPDAAEAARQVPGWLDSGDLVLLKGSRGMHLEKVAKAVFEARGAPMLKTAS